MQLPLDREPRQPRHWDEELAQPVGKLSHLDSATALVTPPALLADPSAPLPPSVTPPLLCPLLLCWPQVKHRLIQSAASASSPAKVLYAPKHIPALAACLIGDNAACSELCVIWAAGEAVRAEQPGAIHGSWNHSESHPRSLKPFIELPMEPGAIHRAIHGAWSHPRSQEPSIEPGGIYRAIHGA